MARYKRKPTLYTLRFDDEPGLEVQARSASIDTLLEIVGLAASLAEVGDLGDMDPEKIRRAQEQIGRLFARFARVLVAWNLDDEDDQPVPCTAESLAAQDLDFVLKIVMTWVGALASVDTPLLNGSNGTPPPGPEASIPMEPLTPGPGS